MSDHVSNADYKKFQHEPGLKHAIKTMPRWKWKLLGIALMMGCVGVAGQITTMYLKGPSPTPVNSSVSPAYGGAPSGSTGFVSGQPTGSTTTDHSSPQSTGPAPVLSPFMTRFGFSLFVGVIVGLIFRTFIKIAAMGTVLVIGAAMALSYFHVVNIDMTAVKAQTADATNWLTDQGYRLKDMLFYALPSSTAATLGFLFGFKRR